jgi:hypothetical protein
MDIQLVLEPHSTRWYVGKELPIPFYQFQPSFDLTYRLITDELVEDIW